MPPLCLCKPLEALWPRLGEPNPLRAAYAQLLAVLGSGPPRPLPLWVAASDVEERAGHLRDALDAMWVYLRAQLGDVAQNVPRDLDFRQIEALTSDLLSEVSGTLDLATAALPGRRA